MEILTQIGTARRGRFETPHGTIETPAFMNVATCGAIKGAVSAHDLKDLKCQVQLCNTYHLHVRPGDELVRELGGLHAFTGWQGPILTDSGGFQVFSLARPAQNPGRGRDVCLPCRRPPALYRAGGEHADPVQPRFHHCHGL